MQCVVRVTLDDQAEERYVRVPFLVPAGASALAVSISSCSHHSCIDLGCEGPGGWRGWSGGARRQFAITSSQATPGYLPRSLEPGEWHVILGLHALDEGADLITVVIEIDPNEQTIEEYIADERACIAPHVTERPRGSVRNLPAEPGLHWYAADFHLHTTHSDGAHALADVVELAGRVGLDAVAITDHNTVSHHSEVVRVNGNSDVCVIAGQEVTTFMGHANVFGDVGFIDFRRPASEWIRESTQRGGWLSINHPIADDCAWWQTLDGERADATEAWHSTWYKNLGDTGIISWLNGRAPTILIGGSDFHRISDRYTPGLPTTWIAAEECTPDAIMDAVRAGRTALSASIGHSDEGVHVPDVVSCPVLLRVSGRLHACNAAGYGLIDGRGRITRIHTDNECLTVAGEGPYRLIDEQRHTVAMCI